MGEGYGLECERCKHSFEIHEGGGFLDYGIFRTEPNGKPKFHEYVGTAKMIAEINDIMRTKENVAEYHPPYDPNKKFSGSGWKMYLCPECRRLDSRYYFRITFTGGEYEPPYHCKKCKKKILPAKLRKSGDAMRIVAGKGIWWKCPKCGHDKVVYNNVIICWD